MDDRTKAPGLDIFKLIVALGLFVVLGYFYLQNQQVSVAAPTTVPEAPTTVPEVVDVLPAPTQVEISWPPFPETGVMLTLDEQAKKLVDPEGEAVYELNAAENAWQPVVPAEMSQFNLAQDSAGKWILVSADGNTRYQWDETTTGWQIAPDFLATLPEFPPSEVKLTYDKATGQLVSPEEVAVYVVDVATGQWVPVIPAELQAVLPESAAVVKAEKSWVIVGTDKAKLYTWSSANLTWVNVSTNSVKLKLCWLPVVLASTTAVPPVVEATPAAQPAP